MRMEQLAPSPERLLHVYNCLYLKEHIQRDQPALKTMTDDDQDVFYAALQDRTQL